MTTVVTGASGTVDRSLVAQLLEAGEPVRAVTRNPAAAGHRAVVRLGDRRLRHRLPAPDRAGGGGVWVEWTHLRPGEFAANRLALWGPSIRAERVVRWPWPDEVGVPIHEADIAAVAVLALLEDGHAGRA